MQIKLTKDDGCVYIEFTSLLSKRELKEVRDECDAVELVKILDYGNEHHLIINNKKQFDTVFKFFDTVVEREQELVKDMAVFTNKFKERYNVVKEI